MIAHFGFYMGERSNSCCWMAWPCRSGMWGDSQAPRKRREVANTIAHSATQDACTAAQADAPSLLDPA
jgi:hypothetical protein